MSAQIYRQSIPALELSIERDTENVPPDGKYYLVLRGERLGAFRSLKKAQERFRELIAEMGHKPEPSETRPKSASELDIERYLETKDLYWAESYRHRGKGGRGGRGGV